MALFYPYNGINQRPSYSFFLRLNALKVGFLLIPYGELANTTLRDVFAKVRKGIRNCYDRLGKQHEGFKIYYDGLAILRNVFSPHRKGIGICSYRFRK